MHHVATMYPLEVQLAQTLAQGKPVEGVTWDVVHEMNARHATENDTVTKQAALDLLRRNSAAAATAIRATSDEELDGAATVSLNADAPLTCQFMLEDHAVRHSYHHLAKIRAALNGSAVYRERVSGRAKDPRFRKEKCMTTVVSCNPAVMSGGSNSVKARQQAMWASGDFAVIGTTLQIVGELLNEAADVQATDRVLDVAAGNGNATLAAARRFASVTSTDYVPALLEGGRRRAEAEGFDTIRFEVADAEALPYANASFDVVLSTFGVMFAPDHERAAGELLRVCKPGGRIGLASWTPSGFLGQLFRVVGQYVPPIPGVRSPLLWGTDAHLRELFASATSIEHATRTFAFRYRSPEHWVDVFRTYYGPVHKAFLALDEDGQSQLEADLIALLRSLNRGGGSASSCPGIL